MSTFKLERAIHALIVLLLAVFVYVIFDSFHEKIVTVGDSAPDFAITTDNGRTITASNFGGKLLVLNFWATWCPPCVGEMPSLDQFQRPFASSALAFLRDSLDNYQNLF